MIHKDTYQTPEAATLDLREEMAILQASNEGVDFDDWNDLI